MKKPLILLYVIAVVLIIFGLLLRYDVVQFDTGNYSGRQISLVGFIIYVITKYFIAPKIK